MNQRTDPPATEKKPGFTREYLLTLSGVALAVMAVVFGIEYGIMPRTGLRDALALPLSFPWIIAAGHTITNGLNAFAGTEPDPITISFKWVVLIPLLLVGVIGPTLALLLMESKTAAPRRLARRGVYLFGVIIVSTYVVTLIPTTIIAASVRSSMRESQAVQRNKDMMINDLSSIVWYVRQYSILPASEGGGGGSVTGFVLPPQWAKTEYGTYSARTNENHVIIDAQSAVYESTGIQVAVHNSGRMSEWEYTGRFN